MRHKTFLSTLLIVSLVFIFAILISSEMDRLPSASAATTQAEQTTNYLPLVIRPVIQSNHYGIEMREITQNAKLDEMVEAGAHFIRYNGVRWDLIEPIKGELHWEILASLEEQLLNAANVNRPVILIVRGAPAWARQVPDSLCGPIKESELPAFANFMSELVKRYSIPPFNVKHWEIGNEPDAPIHNFDPVIFPFGCWGIYGDPYYGGRYYGEMLKYIYPQVKQADPAAKVLFGGLLLVCDPINPPLDPYGQPKDCTPSKFLEGALLNGAGAYFDIVSFHAYDYYYAAYGQYGNDNWHSAWNTTGPTVRAKTAYLRSVLSKYQLNKPLIVSEISVLCDLNCETDFEATKANFLAITYASTQADNLQATIWYDVVGDWRHSSLFIDWSIPTPAYYAYLTSEGSLGSLVFTQVIDEYAGVRGYEFSQGSGQRIWLLWSSDGAPHTIELPGLPSAIWNKIGTALDPVSNLTINIDPIYIAWDN